MKKLEQKLAALARAEYEVLRESHGTVIGHGGGTHRVVILRLDSRTQHVRRVGLHQIVGL